MQAGVPLKQLEYFAAGSLQAKDRNVGYDPSTKFTNLVSHELRLKLSPRHRPKASILVAVAQEKEEKDLREVEVQILLAVIAEKWQLTCRGGRDYLAYPTRMDISPRKDASSIVRVRQRQIYSPRGADPMR